MDERDETGGGDDDIRVPGIEGAVPPSVAGDVEDAVSPKVGGALTPWMPPGQGEGEEGDGPDGRTGG